MLSVVMLNIDMLIVVMLNVDMLSVMVPRESANKLQAKRSFSQKKFFILADGGKVCQPVCFNLTSKRDILFCDILMLFCYSKEHIFKLRN